MLPPPEGVWGMPPEMLQTLPGYDPDVAKNRAEARKIMEKLGYGPDKRLADQGVDAQHPALPRPGGDPDRPAEGDLYRRRARRRRHDAMVSEGHAQGLHGRRSMSPRPASTTPTSNSTRITSAARSATTPAIATPRSTSWSTSNRCEADPEKRKQLVWEIERKLAEDGGAAGHLLPAAATCWQP